MDSREMILSLMRSKGPLLPVEVSKLLNTNILIASAHLSELVSSGLAKVSSVKVGGSPLYYLAGQESKLEPYCSRLHEKERRAFELLKEKKVLRDSEQPAVVRFALRQMRDYAKPVEVKLGEEKLLFWRWFLTPMVDAEGIIKKTIMPEPARPQPAQIKEAAPIREPEKEHLPPKKEQGVRPQTTLREPPKKIAEPQASSKPSLLASGPFLDKVRGFFEASQIRVVQEEPIKKGKQAWFIVNVPSSIGGICYYAEAKSKKKISEGDVSEALVRANARKLPLLFITDGKTCKGVEALMDAEYNGVAIKEI